VLEQFAHAVLGVATTAAIMLNGRITQVGPPAEIEETLSTAYLGGT
jgi:branched-chain amino acid transport system ATP-binding protein